MPTKRIFLSAASDEYGDLRLKLAAKLQRSGINVEHQGIFPQTPSDTVRKLGNFIRECPLLVHIVGHHPGSIAAPAAVADLLGEIPSEEFLVKFPDLRRALGDFSCITYTQWEAFLALHLGVEVLLYAPCEVCATGTKALKSDFPQKHHLDRLFLARKRPDFCADEADFIGNILADVYRFFGLPESELPAVTPSYLPARNPHFRGRKDDIRRLRESLNQSRTIGITQQVAVFASGGVGKSSLALDFAWECFAASPPQYSGGVFWCDCRSRDVSSLADGLALLAGPLGIDPGDNNDPMPIAQKVRELLTNGPPSLLILDNIIDAEQWKNKDWRALLPGGNCSRLLTTRAETLGDQKVSLLSLSCLSEGDARELLQSYRNDVDLSVREDSVKEIIDWFGGLAIGLTVVGIYLGIHRTVTWDAYWKSLREKKLAAVRDTEDLATPADYTDRVDAVIDDVFRSLSLAEQRTLFYVSISPGENVSDRWISELLADDVATTKLSGKTPPGYSSFSQAVIASLLRKSVLLRMIDSPTRRTVNIHQVVRERVRELLQRDHSLSRALSTNVRHLATRSYRRSRQWTQAIAESANLSEAQQLLDSMVNAEIDPDVFTFTALLSKTSTFDDAKGVFEQLKATGHKPTLFTLNTFLSKANKKADAWAIVSQIQAAGEKPNTFTFNQLIARSETFAEAMLVAEKMRLAKLDSDDFTINFLLAKAESFDQALNVVAEMQRNGRKPSLYIFKKMMWVARTYADTLKVVEQMELAGEKPDVALFRAQLSKARTSEEVGWITASIEAAGMKLPLQVFNKLVATAETFEEAMKVVVQMQLAGHKPSVMTFNRLVHQARSDEEVIAVVEQMQSMGVPPKASTLKKLLSKTRTEEDTKAVMSRMRDAGVEMRDGIFKKVLSSVRTEEEALAAVSQMQAAGVPLGRRTLKKVISKAKTYEDVIGVVAIMRTASARIDLSTFKLLLSKTRTEEEAQSVISQMECSGLVSNEMNFESQLSLAGTYSDAVQIIEQMQQADMSPTAADFSAVFAIMNGIPPVTEVLNWYYQRPRHPAAPLDTLIASLRKLHRVAEAMAIVLQHPYLTAGRRLMRDYPNQARAVFNSAKACDGGHPTADYALGMLAIETNAPNDAKGYLQAALQRAKHPKTIETIESQLRLLG